MRIETKENALIAYLQGRIDAENAGEVEKEVRTAVGDAKGRLYLDAADLTYISSAGLRMFLALQKDREESLVFINVMPEVMDIFQVTGFDTIFQVRGPMREISLEGLEKIGRGATADVYRLDAERIVKVHNDRPINTMDFIEQERIVSREVFKHGIPTAIPFGMVVADGRIGVVYEAVNAKMLYAFLMHNPERMDEMIQKEALLLRRINGTKLNKGVLPAIKDRILSVTERGIRKYFSEDTWKRFTDSVRELPDRLTMIHGDYHAGNIMVQENGELILVDVGDCTTGHPVLDLAASIQLPTLLKGIMDEREVMSRLFGLTSLSEEDEKRTLDFYAWLHAYWDKTLKAYTGVADEQVLQDLDYKVKTYAFLIYLYKLALIPRTSEEDTKAALDLLMEQYITRLGEIGSLQDWWEEW